MVGAMLEMGQRSFADRYLVATCVLAATVFGVALGVSATELPYALAGAFAIAWLVSVRAPVVSHARGDTIAVTVDEVFLLPALTLLEPLHAVVTIGVGMAAGMLLGPRAAVPSVRRRYFSRRRAVFNVAQKTLAAGAAAGTVMLLPSDGTAATVAAATVAAAVYAFVSRSFVAIMVSSVSDRPLRKVFASDFVSFVVVSLILWAAGLLVALAATVFGHPVLWIGLALVAVLIGSVVSNRAALQRERVAALLDAAQRISRAGPVMERVRSELERSARTLLDCRAAAIEDHPDATGGLSVELAPGWWLRVSEPRGTEVTDFEAADRSTLEALATIAAPALEHAHTMEQLREADELKAAVIGSVSHDIRTPLYTAVGIADILRDAPGLSEDARADLVVRLQFSIGRVVSLVEGMLDLERYELGRLPEPADADVAATVDRVVATLDGDAGQVTLRGDRDLRARIDAPTLERVVENLVSNALRHTPADEPVEVRYRRESGGIVVMVDDAGPGVPADRREEIFEPFRSGTAGRIGLGLWVARRFVELRGGRIWVETSSRGGAAFRVELPEA